MKTQSKSPKNDFCSSNESSEKNEKELSGFNDNSNNTSDKQNSNV